MEFDLRKGSSFFFLLVIYPLAIMLIGAFFLFQEFYKSSFEKIFLQLLIWILIAAILYFFMVRVYYKSKYVISKRTLVCITGWYKKSIDIESIRMIKESKYPSAGFKQALSWDGISIYYGAGYSNFISPEKQELFVNKLKEINPKIKFMNRAKELS